MCRTTDASMRHQRLRWAAEDAAKTLAGLRDLGASHYTLHDTAALLVDAIVDVVASNERESDDRGVASEWAALGDATEALDEWRAYVAGMPLAQQIARIDPAYRQAAE